MLEISGPHVDEPKRLPSSRIQIGPQVVAAPGDHGATNEDTGISMDKLSIDALVRKHSEEIADLQRKVSVVLDMLSEIGKPYDPLSVPADVSSKDAIGAKDLGGMRSVDTDEKPGVKKGKSDYESRRSGTQNYDADADTLFERTAHWEYQLRRSTWDGMLFFTMGIYSLTDSLMLFIVYLLNIGMQALLVFIIADNLSVGDFDDSSIMSAFQDWRVIYAHNPTYADPFTSVSLGYSVCMQSDLLMVGTQQAEMYNDISAYLNAAFMNLSAGGLLCMAALILWVLTLVRRLSQISIFASAVMTCKPTHDANRFITGYLEDGNLMSVGNFNSIGHKVEVLNDTMTAQKSSVKFRKKPGSEDELHFELSVRRVVSAFMFIIAPQVILVGVLGYYGIKFLIRTYQLEELLLNAIALEVVLNVDSLIFTTLAPETCQSLVKKAATLRVRRPKGRYDTIGGYAKFLCLSAIMVAVGRNMLGPSVLNMREAKRIMCGGDPDFLAVQLQIGPVVAGVPPRQEIDTQDFKYRAILQRTKLETDADGNKLDSSQNVYAVYENAPFTNASVERMNEWRSRTLADWADGDFLEDTFFPCAADDYYSIAFPHLKPATWAAMRDITGDSSVSGCSDVKKHCNSYDSTGGSVRLFCPKTCGGNDTTTGQFMDIPAHGMPEVCLKDRISSLASQDCTELPPAELNKTTAWGNYLNSTSSWMEPIWLKLVDRNYTLVRKEREEYIQKAMLQGCDFFSTPVTAKSIVTGQVYAIDFCETGGVFMLEKRTLRSLCPITCGCKTTIKAKYQNQGISWSPSVAVETQCPMRCWL